MKGEKVDIKIIADTHCHTVASGHAYSSLQEMVTAAKEKGLYAIAITDHCVNMPGSPQLWYFENLRILPKELYGVRLLKGVEANVYNYEGDLDLTDEISNSVEWVIASMHSPILNESESTKERCTKAWLKVAKNPKVNVIGHSGQVMFKFDYETVIPEFAKNGKLVEINNSSFKVRASAINNCKTIAKICKKCNAPIIVNSDSHFSSFVGNFDNALKLLNEVDFPENLIINANVDRFKRYLKEHDIDT